VTAAIVTLHRHLREQGCSPDDGPLAATWSTTIPRWGLAASSAVVIATLRALLHWWGETSEPAEMAPLALAAERDELGIAAGSMDRAVQSFDAPSPRRPVRAARCSWCPPLALSRWPRGWPLEGYRPLRSR
jgi:glucuronokinase